MVVLKPIGNWLVAGFLSTFVLGCSGAVGAPPDNSDEPGDDEPGIGGEEPLPPGQSPEAERCRDLRKAKAAPVPASMRRLSWQEIQNSLSDLFPQTAPKEFSAQLEAGHIPSRTSADLEINESFLRAYRPALSAFVARSTQDLTSTGACKAAQPECLQKAFTSIARRAWRGLSEEQKTFLDTKHEAFRAEIGPVAGFAAALELVFASPHFLFLPDPGSLVNDENQDGFYTSSPQRLAGLWGAAVWGSVPDEQVLAAVENGALDTEEGRREQLDRMLGDERTRRGMTAFFRSWLRYSQILKTVKDQALFPQFNDEIRAEMLEDTESTLLALMFDENETPNALLRSSLGNPGPKTVALLDWGKDNIEAQRGTLEGVGRYGVATHPALLAITSLTDSTSIVNRGRFVVEKLACGHIPEPPKDINIDLEKLDEETGGVLTGRQLAERHASDPACGGCHKFMDPFGLVFENFDPIGRHRSEDKGLPIDTSVEMDDALGITGSFDGATALLEAVAQTGRTESCFATNFANFVMPVALNEVQACSVANLTSDDEANPRSMFDFTREFLLSNSFLTRSSPAN